MADARPQTVTLPFPPSLNNAFSQTKQGRRFPAPKYKKWAIDAITLIRVAKIRPAVGQVSIKITLHPPDNRGRDADNYQKPILDALVKAGVLTDDSRPYVRGVHSVWADLAPSRHAACAVVEIQQTVEVNDAPPPLNKSEARMLSRVRKSGVRLLGPNSAVPTSVQSLAKRGLIRLLPGLLPDAPQGFVAAEPEEQSET